MARLRLLIGKDHVAELARLRNPVGAVEELIWNALDADAEQVTVQLERNDLGGVDRVVLADNGTGIAAEHCNEYFEQIGTSWKRRALISAGRSESCTARTVEAASVRSRSAVKCGGPA